MKPHGPARGVHGWADTAASVLTRGCVLPALPESRRRRAPRFPGRVRGRVGRWVVRASVRGHILVGALVAGLGGASQCEEAGAPRTGLTLMRPLGVQSSRAHQRCVFLLPAARTRLPLLPRACSEGGSIVTRED